MRQQLEARERALKESEEAPAMTAPQAADYKRQLAALMQPGRGASPRLSGGSGLRQPGARQPKLQRKVPCTPLRWPPQPDRAHRMACRCCDRSKLG